MRIARHGGRSAHLYRAYGDDNTCEDGENPEIVKRRWLAPFSGGQCGRGARRHGERRSGAGTGKTITPEAGPSFPYDN